MEQQKIKKIMEVVMVIAIFMILFSIAMKYILMNPFVLADREAIKFKEINGYVWLSESKNKSSGSLFFRSEDNSLNGYLVCNDGVSNHAYFNNCSIVSEIRKDKLKSPMKVKMTIGEIDFGKLSVFTDRTFLLKNHEIIKTNN